LVGKRDSKTGALLDVEKVDPKTGKTVKVKSQPHPGFNTTVGATFIPGARFVSGTDAASFMSRFDQIKGASFLEAFESLKGGGAITEKEGEAATRAMARLDRTQNEADYRAALRDLKSAVTPAIQRQREALSRAQQTVGGSSTSAPVQRARNPQTGEVLELRNGQWVPAR